MTSYKFGLAQYPSNFFFLSNMLSGDQGPGRWKAHSRQTEHTESENNESFFVLFSCPEMMDENREMINKNMKR